MNNNSHINYPVSTYSYPYIIKSTLTTGSGLLFSLVFALLMAISANSFIYLPFTPVPVTTQVFTVLISGLFLGSRWALTGQLIYILMGFMGLPVFSGFKNGPVALTGPTAGYIIGFVAAAFIVGFTYEKLFKNSATYKYKLLISFISCIAGVALIHFFGFVYLAGYFHFLPGTHSISDTLIKTWKSGTQPFLIIDLLKTITIVFIINLKKNNKWKR